ncbi:MAG: trypsin-like peptidase domain-containing protein [Clostridia bacterium]|nr:trypsin-like peptidase domain-containing protein [Clostridia bacterium]
MDENYTPNTTPETNYNPESTPTEYSNTYQNKAPHPDNTNAQNVQSERPGYYNQNQYYQAPQGNRSPYGNQQQPPYQQYYNQQYTNPVNTSINGAQFEEKKKKKKDPGKIIFIILVCLSIVCASVAVGMNSKNGGNALTDNSNEKVESTEAASEGVNGPVGDGAKPNVEDSPVSYSKYSGKGAMTPEQIYQEVKDINVGVIVYSQKDKAGEGSGIVVGPDKTKKYTYILTAAHVIADKGVTIQVQFANGSEVDAQIVGIDSKTDVGVIRVDGADYKSATFGNSDKLAVGQTVYAIGNPGGTEFFGSFTSGMISAIDRPVPTTNSSYDLPCIQHNAAINPGNSGGALVNEYGQVIGLNSSKISSTEYEGMGFSVPTKTVLDVYNQIIEHGYVTNRPMLGITYFPVSTDYTYSSLAWKNDLPYGSIVIATIDENSDMANQNVEVGDVITAVNGKKLETTDILLETIEESKVGDKLTLEICRFNNKGAIQDTYKITVALVEDKGTNIVTEQEIETNPFSSYFKEFGY